MADLVTRQTNCLLQYRNALSHKGETSPMNGETESGFRQRMLLLLEAALPCAPASPNRSHNIWQVYGPNLHWRWKPQKYHHSHLTFVIVAWSGMPLSASIYKSNSCPALGGSGNAMLGLWGPQDVKRKEGYTCLAIIKLKPYRFVCILPAHTCRFQSLGTISSNSDLQSHFLGKMGFAQTIVCSVTNYDLSRQQKSETWQTATPRLHEWDHVVVNHSLKCTTEKPTLNFIHLSIYSTHCFSDNFLLPICFACRHQVGTRKKKIFYCSCQFHIWNSQAAWFPHMLCKKKMLLGIPLESCCILENEPLSFSCLPLG